MLAWAPGVLFPSAPCDQICFSWALKLQGTAFKPSPGKEGWGVKACKSLKDIKVQDGSWDWLLLVFSIAWSFSYAVVTYIRVFGSFTDRLVLSTHGFYFFMTLTYTRLWLGLDSPAPPWPQGNTWSKSFHASLYCQITHFGFPILDSSSSFYVGLSHRSQTAQGWNTLESTFSGQSTLAGGQGSISISGDWSWGVSIGTVSGVSWHTSATRTLKPSSGHSSSVFLSSITSSFIWYLQYCIFIYSCLCICPLLPEW